jgi:hypothetical protein
MNWILDTYSNVYQAAMLQPREFPETVATAKERVPATRRASFLGLLKRR